MHYRERLAAPAWYWLVGVVFGGSTILAVGVWFDPWVAAVGGLVTVAVITVALAWVGRTEIVVTDAGLRVGPSLLEWAWLGTVEALDAAATRAALGVDADARAFVVDRPWLNESVRVRVEDAADPHPYWLVGTRSPARLADAIERARAGAPA